MNKKWQYYETNEDKVDEICEKYKINRLLATIIENRKIEDIDTFLNPTRADFHDPYLLPDMQIAVDRILEAIEQKEKIMIYGDYDVDGITSISVLKKFLEERGLEVDQYIPNRLDEGYGLNQEAIQEIFEKGFHLMITVDCGISGLAEVEFANQLGMQTIITDHHEPLEELPKAVAVIDPKIQNSKYPFNQLAGVGVVFKLIQAIGMRLKLEEKEYLKYLDLVCVGTISDIVPLVDENRVIAKLGLKLVEVTRNIGLKYLLRAAGYKAVDSSTISFGIAPRVNACGRMGHEKEALEIFLSSNIQRVQDLTEKLNQYNKQRQETEKEIFKQAIEQIEQNQEESKNAIILGDERWHHGVIGIVASKITEMYFKPSLLLCFEEGMGKGSGRSVPGFDLHAALSKCNNTLEKFGGHAMAVGLAVKQEKFEDFKKEFEEIAKEESLSEIQQVILIDGQVSLEDMKIEFVEELKKLEPFGEGNKTPIFVYKGLKVNSIRSLSEGKHLKLTLKEEGNVIDAIGFNMGKLVEDYKIEDKVDVAGTLEINEFNGRRSVQINVKDIMKAIG